MEELERTLKNPVEVNGGRVLPAGITVLLLRYDAKSQSYIARLRHGTERFMVHELDIKEKDNG